MGLNLAEIQQKLDRLIHNITEQNRRAYQIFYDPNPQDVELPQLDENGNLITVKIPNRAKIKAEVDGFIAGAETTIKGWWSRVFYVNAESGDDNNPGTSDAPLKTLKAAIDNVPNGGSVSIYLANNAKHYVSGVKVGFGKSVNLVRWDVLGDGSPAVIRKEKYAGFILQRSFLRISPYIDLEVCYDPDFPVHWNVMFKFAYGSSAFDAASIGGWNSDGTDLNKIRMDAPLVDSEVTVCGLVLFNCDIDELGEDTTLARPIGIVHLTGGQCQTMASSVTLSDAVSL